MANSEQVVNIDVKTSGIKDAAKQLSGLNKVINDLKSVIAKTFSLSAITEYMKAAVKHGGELDKEFLVLRLSLGKLKAAIGDAVTPLVAAFIPVVQNAVWAAIRLTKAVGKVIAALFGQGNAAASSAKGQTALATANEKVKRSLAGFDEINRLDTGDSETQPEMTTEPTEDTLSPQLQAVVDKILSLIAPLQAIDFSPAVQAFGRLKEAIAPIQQTLFAGLEWAWHNLLVPLAAWTIEDFLPVFLDTLAAALGVLNQVIVALQPAADWLWENFLQPIAQWTGEALIQALQWLRQRLDSISTWVSENRELVQKIALAAVAIALVNGVLGSFNGLSSLAMGRMNGFGSSLGLLLNPISLATDAVKALGVMVALLAGNWDSVKTAASAAWNTVRSLWGDMAQWMQQNLLTPLSNGFKNMVNGIIGFLNGLIAGVVRGINGIVEAVNKLSFTVPDWIPGLGGKKLGFQLQMVNTPKIPYLARGAVLPANKPFMAVLGDQKHGTNIEAPLDIIKQALSEVLSGQNGETVVQVNFGGSLAQLARVLKPEIDIENRRKGSSLAKGAVW